MYIDPRESHPPARPASAAGGFDHDRPRFRDVDDERAIRTPADLDDEQDFECVCRIHVETRDGKTFYRLVLERE